MRRVLVVTDVVALTLAFIVIEIVGGFHSGDTRSILRDLALLAFGIPVWVALAHGHNLYHADSRRADYGWTDEVAPDHPDGNPVELDHPARHLGDRDPARDDPQAGPVLGADDRASCCC